MQETATVRRGDELGYFAYGGSTVIAVFPPDSITFDEDLVRNSAPSNNVGSVNNATKGTRAVETLVKVGNSLGRWKSA